MQKRYYYTPKKSKKRTKKTNSTVWMRTVFYILTGALTLWLFCILWFNISNGAAGQAVAKQLYQMLGQSAGLISLFLGYWLVQTVRKKSASFLFFIIGSSVTLAAFSCFLTLLRLVFKDSLISGGHVGESLFTALQGVSGVAGAAVFSLAFILVGIHLLFAIPWAVVLQKTVV